MCRNQLQKGLLATRTRTKVYLIVSGILMVATGIVVLANPAATLVSIAWLIGIDVLASGCLKLGAFFDVPKGAAGRGALLFDALASILLGCLYLGNSLVVASVLPYLFSGWAMFTGVEMAVASADLKDAGLKQWWVALVLGICVAALGVFSCMEPVVGATAITALVGCGFIVRGIADFHLCSILGKIGKAVDNVAKAVFEG